MGYMKNIYLLNHTVFSKEKEMAIHLSILAWRISWTEGPGGLQSMGSQKVRHNCVTKQKQQRCFCQKASVLVGNTQNESPERGN